MSSSHTNTKPRKPSWRRRVGDPRVQRRLGPGLMVAGGLLAALGAAWRATGAGNGTLFLDVLGWFTAVAGGAQEARAAAFWHEVAPGPSRRRALGLLVLGLLAALGGCVLSSTVADGAGALAEGAAMGVLIAGVGALLGGFLSLLTTQGADYAARQIERRGEDEW